jgi:UDP-N-acetyl-D-glucosamine dehydrogenase
MGAEVCVHDPYVDHWWEFEAQDTYPTPGKSRSRFFRGQKKLTQFRIADNITETLQGADAVIFAVRHKPFLKLAPEDVVHATGGPAAIIDCFGVLGDDKIKRYFELGCEVKGLGRGHINRLKKLHKK